MDEPEPQDHEMHLTDGHCWCEDSLDDLHATIRSLNASLATAEADRDAYKDALEAIMGQHDHYVVGRPCYQRFDNPSMWCPACIVRVALARGL